jgi:hypothetical protein
MGQFDQDKVIKAFRPDVFDHCQPGQGVAI